MLPDIAKAQSTLTIGTSTSTTSYFPIYTFYGSNYSQSTYLASEIVAAGATSGTPGFINSISWYRTSYYSGWTTLCKDWVVYMGNVSKTTFSTTTDWVPYSSLTEVFNGTFTTTGTGWVTITFPTPFYWDGSSNLVVAVDENTPGYTSTMPWRYTSRTDRRSIGAYSDGSNPNPASPPTSGYSFPSLNGTPNIQLSYTAATPCSGTTVGGTTAASATTLCPGESVGLTVTGATVGTGLTWQWQSASAAAGPWTNITGETSLSLTIAPPAGATTYYRRVTTCTSTSSVANSTGVAVAVGSAMTVPYSEDFESRTAGVNVPCANALPSFDPSTSTSGGSSGATWRLLGSSSTGLYTAAGPRSGSKYLWTGYNIGSNYGYDIGYWFTPGFNLSTGKTYRFNYWYRVGNYVGTYYSSTGTNFGMYYGTSNNSATGLTAIKPDLLGKSNTTHAENSGDFT
ncbi:MAG: hypothetical protein IT256_01025, partial [Chitinophagaceae bacterium]|nr:hypothetical protein [Chitinophagaceae bacterium]